MTTVRKKKMGKKTAEALKKGIFSVHRSKVKLTTGQMLRETRELQGLTQNQLAEQTGISQSEISALEGDHATLGVDRARVLARALKVNPGVLAFPDWDADEEIVAKGA